VYGSLSSDDARRNIATLFPVPFENQRTLAILKPDAVGNAATLAEIESVIAENGFTVVASERVYLSKSRGRWCDCSRNVHLCFLVGASALLT
jgi:hypothetical protein